MQNYYLPPRLGFALVATVVVLLLSACLPQSGGPMKTYTAEEFFDGGKLRLARAIESNELDDFKTNAIGVDLSAPGRRDMTLLWFAMLPPKPNFKAVRLLVELGVNPDEQTAKGIGSGLLYAFRTEDLRYLTAMLDGGFSVDYLQPDGDTMLQLAAGPYGSFEHVKLLVERGANLDIRDSIGGTALTEAIATNHVDSAIYLVEQGADFNTVTVNGVTPAWAVHLSIEDLQPSELRTQFEQLRDLMISKGAKFPPDPPVKVREWMREQGMEVVVPYGWDR